MKAFEVKVGGKKLDYRIGKSLDLKKVRKFFETKYTIKEIYQAGRHVIGFIKNGNQEHFLKLATTEGMSYLAQNEYAWNDYFNRENPRETSPFWIPQNISSGFFNKKLFYIVTDIFEGELLAQRPEKNVTQSIRNHLPSIIAFSERIQALPGIFSETDAQQFFRAKTQSWYEAIPEYVKKKYQVQSLLQLVDDTYTILQPKQRHGDFTPWHLFALENGKLGLIDGEHARGNGVEYYDIAYFIQRVFAVLNDPGLAKDTLQQLRQRDYNLPKLQTVLAARGIGGFLDESLKTEPNYAIHNAYKEYILSLLEEK